MEAMNIEKALAIRSYEVERVRAFVIKTGLNKKSRERQNVYCRYYISAYLRYVLGLTMSEIGNVLNRDHSSVVHGLKQHDYFIETDDDLYIEIVYDVANNFSIDKQKDYSKIVEIIKSEVFQRSGRKTKIKAIHKDEYLKVSTYLSSDQVEKLHEIKEELEERTLSGAIRELVKVYELKNQ